jgi:hypothetical protein
MREAAPTTQPASIYSSSTASTISSRRPATASSARLADVDVLSRLYGRSLHRSPFGRVLLERTHCRTNVVVQHLVVGPDDAFGSWHRESDVRGVWGPVAAAGGSQRLTR